MLSPGIVGRTVITKVARGEKIEDEVCEVVACALMDGAGWRLLVATNDGTLLAVENSDVRLVAPIGGLGPYR